MTCSKIGHRLPFLIGAFLQIVGSLVFLVASNTTLLFIARVTCGAANTLCEIGALMTTSVVFSDVAERAKVMMFTYASSYPISALSSYCSCFCVSKRISQTKGQHF
jgi:MFS family permease